MRWFITDERGRLLGYIKEHKPDGCFGWIVLISCVVFFIISLIASIASFPMFVFLYLKKPYIYALFLILFILNMFLFKRNIPAMRLTIIESVITSIVLMLHNIFSSSSPWEGYKTFSASNYFPENAAAWIGVVTQCILAATLLCFLCSLLATLGVKAIEKIKK